MIKAVEFGSKKINLLKEKQFMQNLAESLPSIVWTTDYTGKYIYCNQQFLNYIGKSFKQIQKLTWKPFIHKDDWKETSRLWAKSLKTGKILSIKHRIKNKKGEYRWHLTQARAIKNEEGLIFLWIGTSTDIHEQKMLDERKNEFISIASHELKTPITSLKGYAQVLNKLIKEDEKRQKEIINKIENQLDKLTDLINDLLDVSRIESGKLEFKFEKFDFDDLVDETLEAIQLITENHKIIHKGQTKKTVYADRERLGQVITNLVTNAIKYSPGKKKVLVETYIQDKNIIFSVRDYGIGIPEEKQEKIFTRFYRVNNNDTYPGLGLGLYISSEIMKRLNGNIWFESVENKGSTFYFSLPFLK